MEAKCSRARYSWTRQVRDPFPASALHSKNSRAGVVVPDISERAVQVRCNAGFELKYEDGATSLPRCLESCQFSRHRTCIRSCQFPYLIPLQRLCDVLSRGCALFKTVSTLTTSPICIRKKCPTFMIDSNGRVQRMGQPAVKGGAVPSPLRVKCACTETRLNANMKMEEGFAMIFCPIVCLRPHSGLQNMAPYASEDRYEPHLPDGARSHSNLHRNQARTNRI